MFYYPEDSKVKMVPTAQRVALVTGANRGIGLEVAQQLLKQDFIVIFSGRNFGDLRRAVDEANFGIEGLSTRRIKGVLNYELVETREASLRAYALEMDVDREDHIERALVWVRRRFGRLDVLINNAAIFIDPPRSEDGTLGDRSIFKAQPSRILRSLQTNTLGPLLTCQKFIPLMLELGFGRVVNVSSGSGQLAEMNGGQPAYRISKTALNAVTRIFSDELRETNVLVNSVCPGWVKTRMGGAKAEISVQEAAQTILWLANLPDGGPSGGFFREMERIDW